MPIPAQPADLHVLQCMDIWSGNQSAESQVSTPAFDIFVYSRPYQGNAAGGDVHYVSLCAGGIVTRLILADVSGHGEAVASTSQTLRSLMRRFMNRKSQTRLVRELNREFSQLAEAGRFATAIVATYLSSGDRFILCNAGHPRPLWYRQAQEKWSYISGELTETGQAFNLPLGLYEATAYQQLQLPLQDGDLLVLYTDAFTEAHNPAGQMLGEEGMLRLIEAVPTADVGELGRSLLERVRDYTGNQPADDDVTLLVLRYSAGRRRTPGVREKLNAYAKMIGLKPV